MGHTGNFWNFKACQPHGVQLFLKVLYRVVHVMEGTDNFCTKSQCRILQAGNMKILFKIDIGKILFYIGFRKRKCPCKKNRAGCLSFLIATAVIYTPDSQNTGHLNH